VGPYQTRLHAGIVNHRDHVSGGGSTPDGVGWRQLEDPRYEEPQAGHDRVLQRRAEHDQLRPPQHLRKVLRTWQVMSGGVFNMLAAEPGIHFSVSAWPWHTRRDTILATAQSFHVLLRPAYAACPSSNA